MFANLTRPFRLKGSHVDRADSQVRPSEYEGFPAYRSLRSPHYLDPKLCRAIRCGISVQGEREKKRSDHARHITPALSVRVPSGAASNSPAIIAGLSSSTNKEPKCTVLLRDTKY